MSSIPELIIGIDVGTSSTGVAYFDRTNGNLNQLVRVFNMWPGAGSQGELRVPTKLTYQHEGQDEPIRWGFQSNADYDPNDQGIVKDGFKLDFGCLQAGGQGGSDPQARFRSARRSYLHYLRKVYAELEAYFTTYLEHWMPWDDTLVHFVFSYPVTWFEETLEEFKKVIKEAGFGQGFNHQVSVSLTEPSAMASAATYEGIASLKKGEIILVVDIGKSRVNLTPLRTKDIDGGFEVMDEISTVRDDAAGAVYIDRDFEELSLTRLMPLRDQLQPHTNPTRVASLLVKDPGFQCNKHDLGRLGFEDHHVFSLRIPLRDNISSLSPHVQGREMQFTFGELKSIFDTQIRRIFSKIEQALENMDTSSIPNGRKALARILFSGGLTNSRYVQQEFRSWKVRENISAELIFIVEPKTAVCKGLVYEAVQRLVQGKVNYPHFLMRSSLGFPYRERLRWYKRRLAG